MATTIEISLTPELAAAYEAATPEERAKIQLFMQIMVEQVAGNQRQSLREIAQQLTDEAEANGLTPEILDALLNDDE